MITIRKSSERGTTNIDWLNSYHSFSFGDFYNPDMIHFGPLRVLNDDRIAGGGGFPKHPHKDMEIITYVLQGSVEHNDSSGGNGVTGINEVQKMSAGRGVFHSEFNHSKDEELHLFQTWIIPNKRGLTPYYEQKSYAPEAKLNNLYRVASPTPNDNEVFVSQDAEMYVSYLESGKELSHAIGKGRGVYLQVASGGLTVNGQSAETGDAFLVENEEIINITANKDTEIILFDVAMEFAM
jgi:redox-sensitive bicupin YhaK (pirin superfamily)